VRPVLPGLTSVRVLTVRLTTVRLIVLRLPYGRLAFVRPPIPGSAVGGLRARLSAGLGASSRDLYAGCS
jgi:hypothetical protein